MHQQYAEQIRFSVVLFFLRVKETKQHHSKEEWNQYIVLTHLSPRGTQEDTSCRQWWYVWLWVCNGVINYMPLVTCVCCVYFQCNIHEDYQHMALHRKRCWLVCHICTVSVLFHVWIPGQCQVLLSLEHLWMTGVCRPLCPLCQSLNSIGHD